jgi:hypothetical protein
MDIQGCPSTGPSSVVLPTEKLEIDCGTFGKLDGVTAIVFEILDGDE